MGTWASLAGGQARPPTFQNHPGLAHGKKQPLSLPPTPVTPGSSEGPAVRAACWAGVSGACPHRVGGQPPCCQAARGACPCGHNPSRWVCGPRWGVGGALRTTPNTAKPAATGAASPRDRQGQACVWEAFRGSGTKASWPSVCLGSRTPTASPSVSSPQYLELGGDGVSGPHLPQGVMAPGGCIVCPWLL